MPTRRNMLKTILSVIPVPFIAKYVNALEPVPSTTAPKEVTSPTGAVIQCMFPPAPSGQIAEWTGSNNKFYYHFVDMKTNEVIDGLHVKPFISWIPEFPDKPRWVRFNTPIRSGYRGEVRAYRSDFVTYLDSELKPLTPERPAAMVGPSFKYHYYPNDHPWNDDSAIPRIPGCIIKTTTS